MSGDVDDPSAGRAAEVREVILVVEDNAAVRATVILLLKTLKYRVLEAESGRGALDILRSEAEVDLLFTDVVMPGDMSGTTLAAKARELRPEVRVLFTSGFHDASMHGGPAISADDDILTKPYRRDVLASKLRQVLDKGKRGRIG